ncbi:hypothetical protein GCM10022232_70530 [Streptomyces plumbiresistens]|uniref:Uncharacterized protein n=1 Tax=Streptomyces plumbiresistens TaxID=511811 RepID=A0ABP7SVF5_9ACTN
MVDRYVDVMEAVVQRTRHSVRIGEVLVEDPGDIDSHQLAVARRFRTWPTSAPFLIGIRLAFAWQGLVRRQPMQSERMAEQRCLKSGQSNPGSLTHRRAEDSILLITPTSVPSRRPHHKLPSVNIVPHQPPEEGVSTNAGGASARG